MKPATSSTTRGLALGLRYSQFPCYAGKGGRTGSSLWMSQASVHPSFWPAATPSRRSFRPALPLREENNAQPPPFTFSRSGVAPGTSPSSSPSSSAASSHNRPNWANTQGRDLRQKLLSKLEDIQRTLERTPEHERTWLKSKAWIECKNQLPYALFNPEWYERHTEQQRVDAALAWANAKQADAELERALSEGRFDKLHERQVHRFFDNQLGLRKLLALAKEEPTKAAIKAGGNRFGLQVSDAGLLQEELAEQRELEQMERERRKFQRRTQIFATSFEPADYESVSSIQTPLEKLREEDRAFMKGVTMGMHGGDDEDDLNEDENEDAEEDEEGEEEGAEFAEGGVEEGSGEMENNAEEGGAKGGYLEAHDEEDRKPQFVRQKSCVFCRPFWARPELDPMNVPLLMSFMTGTGLIFPKRVSGCCAKHQRKLAKTIKRARNMGIFHNKRGGFAVENPFKPPLDDSEEDEHAEHVQTTSTLMLDE
ncbi:30S ribosomal protein S18 [Balamuthia mandrillaris]